MTEPKTEFIELRKLIEQAERYIRTEEAKMTNAGFTTAEINAALEPGISYLASLKEELDFLKKAT